MEVSDEHDCFHRMENCARGQASAGRSPVLAHSQPAGGEHGSRQPVTQQKEKPLNDGPSRPADGMFDVAAGSVQTSIQISFHPPLVRRGVSPAS
jgi:hypothetical protein